MLTSSKSPAEQIVDFMNRVYYNNLTTLSGGNLSICDSDGSVWISPSGYDKGNLTQDDIVKITPDGEFHGKHKPSMEHHFHRAIYRKRPMIKAVLHAHPPMLVSFSIANQIPDISKISGIFNRGAYQANYAPYAVPGSLKLGENIAEEFANGNSVVMLENHGVVVGATTMPEAFQKFETMDHVARMIYGAKLLGGKINSFTPTDNAEAHSGTIRKTPEEEAETAKIISFAQRAYKRGLCRSGNGTIAWRIAGSKRFLITVAECERDNMQPADVAVVSENGEVEAGKKVLAADLECCRTILQNNPALNAVYMAQPPAIMAYAISDADFDPRVIPESYLLLREAPRFQCGERMKAAQKMSTRYPAAVVANDCIITAGATLLQAFDRLEVMEFSARATISAVPFGGMQPMNEQQVAEIVKEFNLEP